MILVTCLITAGFSLMWDWDGASGFDVDTGSTKTCIPNMPSIRTGESSVISYGNKYFSACAYSTNIPRIEEKQSLSIPSLANVDTCDLLAHGECHRNCCLVKSSAVLEVCNMMSGTHMLCYGGLGL